MFDHFSTLCMEGLMSQFFSDAIKIENDYSKGHLNKFVEKGIFFPKKNTRVVLHRYKQTIRPL